MNRGLGAVHSIILREFRALAHLLPLARLALLLSFFPNAQAATLIETNSNWRFRLGTNEVSNPKNQWRRSDFSDSSWPSGPSPFYYGETHASGTQITDMQGRYSSLFFRRPIPALVRNANEWLKLEVLCDDGFIAWINGIEIARSNVPEGERSFNTFASASVQEPISYLSFYPPDPATYLLASGNVLAIQVFNSTLGSSDIQFNVRLATYVRDLSAPAISNVDPAPGLLKSLGEVTVTFTESVTGIDAEDLWLNGVPAQGVRGAGAVYTFTFAPQKSATQSVTWFADHRITDLGTPANGFDAALPKHSWIYEVEDTHAPQVSQVAPAAGATVRELRRVEVVFDEAVEGIDAADLLVNGRPAASMSASSATAYRFDFDVVSGGSVEISWSPIHGIRDSRANPFGAFSWSYRVDASQALPDVVLNEFMAGNVSATGLKDEDGETEDWIELHNRGSTTANLTGWSLSDDPDQPSKWVFSSGSLPPGGYWVVLASGKDKRPGENRATRFHTNFKLSINGEYLGLFAPGTDLQPVSEINPSYPEQRVDHSYGRLPNGSWAYFKGGTPGASNGASLITQVVEPVHFSVRRGLFSDPFNLTLNCPTPGARIRFTLDGSEPAAGRGFDYVDSLLIKTTAVVRAAAFLTNHLSSRIETHSYYLGLPAARRSLPVLSLVTATNNLRGAKGIMEINPRNTTKTGIAWERPVSAEYILPADNSGFQVDCGIRVQGGQYIRGLYNPSGGLPFSKYSFRLYFRGDYGPGHLSYPLFGDSRVTDFDRIVLRAGMNDHSNPFIVDELVRQLMIETGQATARGNFVNLFINGVYKGYYNPTEGYEEDFFQAWHGGGKNWDLIAQFGEVVAGDATAFNAMRNHVTGQDQSLAANYRKTLTLLDVTNMVDYLLVNIYAQSRDWPNNNWRAAKERTTNALFRFYVWDAEWAFGNVGGSVSGNTLTSELASDTEIGRMYRALIRNPEYRLLFADRAQKHFFGNGRLMENVVTNQFNRMRAAMSGVIPSLDTAITRTWVPQRRRHMFNHLSAAKLYSSNAPALNHLGGRVPSGFTLTLSASNNAAIYYTTNGTDPRIPFTGVAAPSAIRYEASKPQLLLAPMEVKARSLTDTNWSALTEAQFQINSLGVPIAISEIMYNPIGGDAYEFIELFNTGGLTIDLGGMRFDGIAYTFPPGSRLNAGSRLILGSSLNPTAFASRYPGITVAGRFTGSLANSGERLALLDSRGQTVVSVDYGDSGPWPEGADGDGYSLELIHVELDPDDPANWQPSKGFGGSPGATSPPGILPGTHHARLNEIMADNSAAPPGGSAAPDWIELHNYGEQIINLSGWSLTDDNNRRKYVFPSATIPPKGFLIVWCDDAVTAPGLHAGFSLDREGETIAFYDAATNRIDAITFGAQIPGYTLGRIESDWLLGTPSPNALNTPAALAPASAVTVNEWAANPAPGTDDWIEFYNRDETRPAALHGYWLATSNALFQIRSLAFVAPRGFAVFQADENPGPNHLDLKLSAEGGLIVLHGPDGAELERSTYKTQPEGASYGRLPDGAASFASFAAGGSPGVANFVLPYNGPRLNEIMANNAGSILDSERRVADWIELINTNSTAQEISGMTLSLDSAGKSGWRFPDRVSVPARGYLLVWCNGSRPASTTIEANLNSGFALPSDGASVYLLNPNNQVVDSISFGPQIADKTIGQNSGIWRLLDSATPGKLNAAPTALAAPMEIRINEWMADPASGDDWIELYNRSPLPADIGGMHLTDDPSIAGKTLHSLNLLSFIAGRGWVLLQADSSPQRGPSHLDFSLDPVGETIRLYSDTLALVDSVEIELQPRAVSDGRFPDGSIRIERFTHTSSPNDANYLHHPALVIHELLTHTDPPLEDALELLNSSDQDISIGGWWLSNNRKQLAKHRIAQGSIVPARGFLVIYESAFNRDPSAPESFTFNSAHGGEVVLAETASDGQLTGFRVAMQFGAARNGVSFVHHRASTGAQYPFTSRRTFGNDSATTLDEFRRGNGLPNAAPAVGPIVITEVFYQAPTSPSGGPGDTSEDEFVELHNPGANPISLSHSLFVENTWRISGGIRFQFPRNTIVDAGAWILLVPFDPSTNGAATASLRNRLGIPTASPIWGPYEGRLANSGDVIAIEQPDTPQGPGHPDAGFVPYVLVETVQFSSNKPWPPGAAGSGFSIQRFDPLSFGNDPAHWTAAPPTPGRATTASASADADSDGMPDSWELAFGLDPNASRDGTLDLDGDGLLNVAEYRVGTDPREASRTLAVEIVTEGNSLFVEFEAQPRRRYTLQSTPGLGSETWTDGTMVRGGESPQFLRLPVSPPASPFSGFYRVLAVPD